MPYLLKVFISHAWSYGHHYESLSDWLFGQEHLVGLWWCRFRDVSIPKDDPLHLPAMAKPDQTEALRRGILARVADADIVIGLTGIYASHSQWIEFEMQGAKALGVPILAVNPWGQERKSATVVEAADGIVGWNRKSVIDGVIALAGGRARFVV